MPPDAPSSSEPPAAVFIMADSRNVRPGESVSLGVTFLDAAGQATTGTGPTLWTTSNPLIAVVGPDGTLVGARSGVVVITGESSGLTASAEFSVATGYEGDLLEFPIRGDTIHFFTDSFGGIHTQVSVTVLDGTVIPAGVVRYVEVNGDGILSAASGNPLAMPVLLRGATPEFGRDVVRGRVSADPGPPGSVEPFLWRRARLFTFEFGEGSPFHMEGLERILSFRWPVQSETAGPCLLPGAMAATVRSEMQRERNGEQARFVVLAEGSPGDTLREARLINPALLDDPNGAGEELDGDWVRAHLSGAGGRALVVSDELSGGEDTVGNWTLLLRDTGDPFCDGHVPTAVTVEPPSGVSGKGGSVGIVSLQATNAFNEPATEAPFSVEVTTGTGIIFRPDSATGEDGSARATWVLGPEVGTQSVRISVPAEGGSPTPGTPVSIDVMVEPGFPWRHLVNGDIGFCGWRLSQLWCWTGTAPDRLPKVTPTEQDPVDFFGTSVGTHICSLDSAGQAFCRGANHSGQLGDGSQNEADDFVAVAQAGERFVSLSLGGSHTCGLTADSLAWCWGSGASGALGTGDRMTHLTPTLVTDSLRFGSLSAGQEHTCALSGGGQAFCWGNNGSGRLGIGTDSIADVLSPVAVSGDLRFSELALGAAFTCGLTVDGQAFCWGDGAVGQLGNGTTTGSLVPAATSTELRFQALQGGWHYACALTADGSAHCWGQGFWGNLGNGESGERLVPTAVAGGLRFGSLALGGSQACGLSTEGFLWCWGLRFPADPLSSDQSLAPVPLRDVFWPPPGS